MWARNCLFVAICLAGAGLVADTLLRRERVQPPRSVAAHHQMDAEQREFDASLHELDAEFQKHWQHLGLQSAPRADDLVIARRLALALVGTLPSLEEIRALEAVRPDDRIAWWTSHLLEDRRFAD